MPTKGGYDMTKRVMVGDVAIGAGAPVSIQSMTNTDTRDHVATSEQIKRLSEAGADIVRFSVYDAECVQAIDKIKKMTDVPLVADIHFDYRLAIDSIKHGIDKIRFNPGNIGDAANVKKLVAAAKERNVPIRIGVNGGSLEKELLAKYGKPTPEAMVESAMGHIRILQNENYDNVVVSLKASNVKDTVAAYTLMHQKSDLPLHVGVTEAGHGESALVKSSIGIGMLLLSGIGDTIRVSMTGDPMQEVEAAKLILASVGLKNSGVEIVSCPTCGRTPVDLEPIVLYVKKALSDIKQSMKVAVMGCVVNGPGEAREADIGIAFGKGSAAVFKGGEMLFTAPTEEAIERLIAEARMMARVLT